jgi:serine/threonine-protein kinase RsbW
MALDKFEIELESKIDNLPVISNFVSETLSNFRADESTINKVQLAIDEASTNIINYAYSGASGTLKIALELVGQDIVITIRDKGKPFDPTSVTSPDVSQDLEHRKIGGLGIYFIKKLMDNVSYSFDPREGNRLILRKRLSIGTSVQ